MNAFSLSVLALKKPESSSEDSSEDSDSEEEATKAATVQVSPSTESCKDVHNSDEISNLPSLL